MDLRREKPRLRQAAVKVLVADRKLDLDEALDFDDALIRLADDVAEPEQRIDA